MGVLQIILFVVPANWSQEIWKRIMYEFVKCKLWCIYHVSQWSCFAASAMQPLLTAFKLINVKYVNKSWVPGPNFHHHSNEFNACSLMDTYQLFEREYLMNHISWGLVNDNSEIAWIMFCHGAGDKPLSTLWLTIICYTNIKTIVCRVWISSYISLYNDGVQGSFCECAQPMRKDVTLF